MRAHGGRVRTVHTTRLISVWVFPLMLPFLQGCSGKPASQSSGSGSSAGPDKSAPTVSIVSPASGNTVSNTITITATASDPDSPVAFVQLLLDGVNLGAQLTQSPYSFSWNTTTAVNGTHTLTAIAKDPSGNQGTSAAVTVKVSNAVSTGAKPPTLIISNQTGISNASSLSGSGAVTNPSLVIYLNQPHGTFGGANNCLAIAAHVNSTWTLGTPSDNIGGDTYTALSGATGTQNNVTVKTWIVFGVPAGVNKITIPTSGSSSTAIDYLGGWAQEFYNCGSNAGGSGFLAFTANGSANNVTLSAAPNNGDTVVAYAVDTQFGLQASSCIGNPITFSAGWTQGSDSTCYGKMSEFNSSTISTSVPITFAGSEQIAMVAFVIPQGAAGTSPSGMYIDHEQAEQANSSSSSFTTTFPSSGNLAVILYNNAATTGVTSVSATNAGSPTWATNCGPIFNSVNSGELVQIIYGTGATLSSTTTITLTQSSGEPSVNPEFLSFSGAKSSSFVKCTAGTTGMSNTPANLTTDSITPTNVGDFLINNEAHASHTATGLVEDSNRHTPSFLSSVDTEQDNAFAPCSTPATNASSLNGDNGYSILVATDTLPTTFIYTGTVFSVCLPTGWHNWSAITAEFQ